MIYLQKTGYGLVGRLTTHDPGETIHDPGQRSRELMNMPYSDYLASPEWDVTRKAALKAAGYRCQLCNGDGELHVHHRTYERRGVELPRDVIALCADCHQVFHGNREAGS